MKIKRYLEKDMRHVLRRVREDQGPDAVILSNRRVEDGIEVIAALDYDEALIRHAVGNVDAVEERANVDVAADIEADKPAGDVEIVSSDLTSAQRAEEKGNDFIVSDMRSDISSMRGLLETQLSALVWKERTRQYPLHAQVLRNFTRLGLAPDVANVIVDRLGSLEELENLWDEPLASLAETLPVVDDDLLHEGGTVALIGPTGVGKTTTIAKIAAQFAMNNWVDDIALVSADSYRIGAKEHLMAFANIIGVNVYSASNFDELSATLDQLKDKKLVLIDTEGRSQRDRNLANRLAAYGRDADRVRFYLTLSAAAQEAALDETIREFNKVPLEGAIVTKVDEATQLGCVISALIRNDLPAAWFTDGQRIPEDLHDAASKTQWLVSQAIDRMPTGQTCIDEAAMAEQFANVDAASV